MWNDVFLDKNISDVMLSGKIIPYKSSFYVEVFLDGNLRFGKDIDFVCQEFNKFRGWVFTMMILCPGTCVLMF